MTANRIIIIDLTGEVARVCDVTGESALPMDDFAVSFSVAVGRGDDRLFVTAGNAVQALREDRNTLLFDHLDVCLPDFEDEELFSLVTASLWDALGESLPYQHRSGTVSAYVIAGHRYPVSVLEQFRQLCASNDRLGLAGFISEEASFLVGLINTPAFQAMASEIDASTPVTFCAIATDQDYVDAACFDYRLNGAGRRSLLIRDFFRARVDLFGQRLRACEGNHGFSMLISIESSALSERQWSHIEAAFDTAECAVSRVTAEPDVIRAIRLQGGARLARCRMGRGREDDLYSIESEYNIGIQIEPQRFHPIITSQKAAGISRFPFTAGQMFRVRGMTTSDVKINFYCGHTDSIKDSTLITSIALSRAELLALSEDRQTALGAKVTLSTRGSGEAFLEALPGGRLIGSSKFVLPGLTS